MGRALGRTRLSVSHDESTSIERQREAIEQWCQINGHTVIGWADDIDISGSLDPFDTPGLGTWLRDRADQFDLIVTWKLDRLSRNSIRLNKLFGWCLDHGKTVTSTTEGIDLGTPVGRLIANVIAFLAEGELEAIRERTISSRRKLRETARWAGGRPPYGYQAEAIPGGGWRLVVDDEARRVLRRVAERILTGESLARIAGQLNDDKELPPADHYRRQTGKKTLGGVWKTSTIRKMMQSPNLGGFAHLNGVPTFDNDGQPVRLGPELFSDDERERIRAALELSARGSHGRYQSSPLAGVVFCYRCGSPLSLDHRQHAADAYRCHTGGCTARIPEGYVKRIVSTVFLSRLHDEPATERIWVPGDSNEKDLTAAVSALDQLSAAAGAMTSTTAKERLQQQLAALDAQIAALEQQPRREGHYEDRPTGETYGQLWGDAPGWQERADLLRKFGFAIRFAIIGDRRKETGETLVSVRMPGTDEWRDMHPTP